MTELEKLTEFIKKADFKDLTHNTKEELKIRLLDSFGCAFGALRSDPILRIQRYIDLMGGSPLVTLINGKKTSPDRAAFYNGALIRYLDFNDSFLAKHETCHPSDNIAGVLAAAEFSKISGKEFLLSLAISYAVQCRLSEVAPVRAKGFDHTVQGSYATAAGVAKALKLSPQEIANAISISAVAHNALRVTRTGALSHWKGLAYPETAFTAVHSAFLAREGITGPAEIFEGNKGFMDAISGRFSIDWNTQDLQAVEKTIIKKYNAEIHSQTSIEAALELKRKHSILPQDIEKIEIAVFDVAFHIIGGGVEGDKTIVRTKEEADHSLHYMVAVALLDDEVMPSQYRPERIVKNDVQELLKKIHVRDEKAHTDRFPNEMVTHVTIHMKDGKVFTKEKSDYEGFWTKPMSFDMAFNKFKSLAEGHISAQKINAVSQAVHDIENIQVVDLCKILGETS